MKKIIVFIGFLCWALGVSAQFGGGVTITGSGGKIDTAYLSNDTLVIVENGDTTIVAGVGGVPNFTNGLQSIAGSGGLGGILTQNTEIDGDGYDILNYDIDSFYLETNKLQINLNGSLGKKPFLSSFGGNGGGLDSLYNLFLGYNTGGGMKGQLGYANVVIGSNSARSLSGGSGGATSNVIVGGGTAEGLTTGSYNTIIGTRAGALLGTSSGTTAVGHHSLKFSTTGNNTAVGRSAGEYLSTGTGTFLGYFAGAVTTIGTGNTFVGQQSGWRNIVGLQNTFIGHETGYNSVSSAGNGENTLVGYRAGYNSTTAILNTFLGHTSGQFNTTGSQNTGAGRGALNALATGNENTALGLNAGSSLNSGNKNIFIGRGAGSSGIVSKSNNIIIGYNTNPTSDLDSLYMLAKLFYATSIYNRMAANYKIGVGDSILYRTWNTTKIDTATNTTTVIESSNHKTTATPLPGFGVGKEMALQDAAGNREVAQLFDVKWTDATNGSEDASIVESLIKNGGLDTVAVTYSDGSMQYTEYGLHTFTGTPTTFAAYDITGRIIERTNVELLSDIDADPSITNEGSLSLSAATSNSVEIVSNTSGSTPVEIGGDANTIITENTGTNDITISANQPILVHLTPLSFTDSLKTTGVKSGDYFTIPAAYNGYTIKSVVYGVRTASSGSGDVVVGLNIYNNSAPRGTSFVNALSATFSAGEVEEITAGGGLTVTTGQLIVPNLSTDTAVTHALGLTISIVLQPQ